MDSRIGLDYIVENRDYIAKLGAALDTQNATVKKQVFELLSALCAYSPDGYARAIETLEFYKVSALKGRVFKLSNKNTNSALVLIAFFIFTESQEAAIPLQDCHQRTGAVECRRLAAAGLPGRLAGLHQLRHHLGGHAAGADSHSQRIYR